MYDSNECCDAIITEGIYRWNQSKTYKKLNILLKLENNNNNRLISSSSNYNNNNNNNNNNGDEKRRLSKAEKKKNMQKNKNANITATTNEVNINNISNKKDMLIMIELFVNKDGKYQIIMKSPVDICKSYMHALHL
jgi:hypothetical protein